MVSDVVSGRGYIQTLYMPTLNGGEISITPSPRTKSIGMLRLVDCVCVGGGGGGGGIFHNDFFFLVL